MNEQQGMSANARAFVQGYRTIEELVPAHWREGDVVANGIR
jgi:hypothetical protein